MELLTLRFSHSRLFPDQGTVVIATINSKTSNGLQQSLSLHEPFLVQVLQFLWDRVSPSEKICEPSPIVFRREFASLIRCIGLRADDYLPYCRHGLGRTVVQGRWRDRRTARVYVDDARATLVQLLLPAHVTALQASLASFWRVALPGG